MSNAFLVIGVCCLLVLVISVSLYFTNKACSIGSWAGSNCSSPPSVIVDTSPADVAVATAPDTGVVSQAVPGVVSQAVPPSGTSSPVGYAPLSNHVATTTLPAIGVVNGAAAGSAGTISGINWVSHLNNDYPSSTMQYLPNQTRTQCAAACAANSSCKAFSTGGRASETFAADCNLKNTFTASSLVPNTNLNVYSKP